MPRLNVPQRSPLWPRVAVLASVGLLAAGCADSGRFQSSSFDFNPGPPRPQGDITGSVNPPPQSRRVVSQPLPAPAQSRPVMAANNGAEPPVAYRPADRSPQYTGTVHAAPQPAGHWTWDGGSAVTVAYGQTLDQIAHKYGVPASAIMQVNHMRSAADLRPGQRLVIPRYISGAVAHTEPRAGAGAYTVAPGDTMMSIAHKHGVTLTALAHANNMKSFGTISIGQRLTIPGGGKRMVAEHEAAPTKIEKPQIAKNEVVGTVPSENARLAKPEVKLDEPPVKTAEPAGAMPSFRWPVKGRIIAAFGTRSNGTQNDGINLAVPAGTPVHAADDGVVAYAGNELKGYGNLVLIRHANGYVSAYANASELLVKRGDTVRRGQVIAHAGQTGNVSSPQLHFEIRKGSVPVDPTKYLSGA